MAAEHGLLQVHHVLKQSLLDLHLTGMAAFIGDSHRYNVVAALPSMHAAFPVVALVVAVRYGLPRWLIALQAAQLIGVWFAVVYLGDHYLVDAVAGAAVALAGVAIAHRLLSRPAPRSERESRRCAIATPARATAAPATASTR